MHDACKDTEHGGDDHDRDAERVRLSLVSICCERQRLLHRGVDQADDDGVHRDQCDQTDVQRIRVCFAAEDGGGYRRGDAERQRFPYHLACLEQTPLVATPALETLSNWSHGFLPATRFSVLLWIPFSSYGAARESV